MSGQLSKRASSGPVWYVVASVSSEAEASILVGRLSSLDIPATAHRAAGSAALGFTLGSLWQVQVLVPEKYYRLAMAALEPDDSLPALDDGEE